MVEKLQSELIYNKKAMWFPIAFLALLTIPATGMLFSIINIVASASTAIKVITYAILTISTIIICWRIVNFIMDYSKRQATIEMRILFWQILEIDPHYYGHITNALYQEFLNNKKILLKRRIDLYKKNINEEDYKELNRNSDICYADFEKIWEKQNVLIKEIEKTEFSEIK